MVRGYERQGGPWLIGDPEVVSWIRDCTHTGLTIGSAIPRLFDAYATITLPENGPADDRPLLDTLARWGAPQWWLGYLRTGSEDFEPDLPRVTLYAGWEYTMVLAGRAQAETWRAQPTWRGTRLPDLIFPIDRTWLVSHLWDDTWRCIGGPDGLIEQLSAAYGAHLRRVGFTEDATPPGRTSY